VDIEYRDLDKRIWEEELAAWVPHRVYDAHAHLYRATHPERPDETVEPWMDDNGMVQGTVDLAMMRRWNSSLLPGRTMAFLIPGWPAQEWRSDPEGQAAFLAAEAAKDPLAAASMVVTPEMETQWIAEQVQRYGFVGLKPYRTYAADPVNCRITDMLPEEQVEMAHDKGLLITMHLAKERALSDPENIEDLRRLSARYPRARWIMAHCGRCFAPWAAEGSFEQIKDLPNVWYDISAVCAAEVMDLLLATVPSDRVLYASDAPAGWQRAKYVWWGYAWQWMKEGALPTAHADGRATFVLYEQLRALKFALRNRQWDRPAIEDLFYNNAMKLVHGAQPN